MQRFTNILVVSGCDRSVLEHAASLAKRDRAKLTVVQVVQHMPPEWRQFQLGDTSLNLQELAIAECQSRLNAFTATLDQDDLRVSTRVLVGTPFLEITRDVIANQRDLVMMTAEGEGGVQKRFFGSTSLHLMRKCPCPVWVFRSTRPKKTTRILAAIDPDVEDETHESLNATVLQLASSIANHEDAELHVAHAWVALGEGLLRNRTSATNPQIDQYVCVIEGRVRRAVQSLVQRFADKTSEVHLVKGNPAEVIPGIVQSREIDLLVMGTVCRTGIAGFFIGNTAEMILDEVNCSVLTVKPNGFVSPVEIE
jgi:nucleotide-binding universal stress UspA family protein